MKTLTVGLGDRAYPIHIGAHLLEHPELVANLVTGRQVMIVTNERVGPLYRPALETKLGPLAKRLDTVTLPDGEQYKTLAVLEQVFDGLLRHRHNRKTVLVALGGGVVGDMTGFAAACYQRGVDFIQMPTTLLAQVDSSVGGKTGVNHPLGKNMIGAFHQPLAVVIDVATLATLPTREFSAGLAEVIKYGLIRDLPFLAWLEENMARVVARDEQAMIEMIERSCRNKAAVVAADEREEGVRATLNLGHTFGHAIETGCGYGVWLHGEAVAAGMVMAADLSARLGWLEERDVRRVADLIVRAGLPVRPPAMGVDDFLAHMQVDKKNIHGRIRLVLLRALGNAVVTDEFPHEMLLETLGASLQDSAGTGS